MAFEDVAARMAERRKPTRGERLEAIWTGKEIEVPPLPEPIEPVAPAKRTAVLVGAYAVLILGLLVVMAGAGVLLLFLTSLSSWERRGLYFVIAIGIAIIVQATRMFAAVEQTAPLPDARLRP